MGSEPILDYIINQHKYCIFQSALEEFKSLCDTSEEKDVKPLMELLEENIHTLATGLPRTMRVAGKCCDRFSHSGWINLSVLFN